MNTYTHPYINTNDGLTVFLGGKPYTVARDSAVHEEVERLVVNRLATAQTLLDIIERAAAKVKAACTLNPDMQYSGGVVLFRGEVLHNYATQRLVAMIEAGQDATPLANFLTNLMKNPSKRVVDHLYAFLEHGSVPLTRDGHFLVYKAVRKDFKDIHSGTFDNSVGQTVKMPRNRVDEDPDRTCSAGLHVCSFDYLPHFSHADGHVMVCKVNPANVVAIPADYNNTKMRVSEYEVIGEVEDYYGKRADVLGDIGRSTGVKPPRYRVGWYSELSFSDEDDEASFDSLAGARTHATELLNRLEDTGHSDVVVEVYDDEDCGLVVFAAASED